MSVRDTESFKFFSSLPRPIFFKEKMDVPDSMPISNTQNRKKFLDYEVNSDNLHRAIRDLTFPFEILKHFDEKRKANRKLIPPLKFFSRNEEARSNMFSFYSDNENAEVTRYKGKLADLQMAIHRRREKGESLVGMPDIIAENLRGMTCDTYFMISRNISNVLWLFSDAVRKYHFLKNLRQRRNSDNFPTVYNLVGLSETFETIFYGGYEKMGQPDFRQLSGPNFLNFLKWRSICHSGPFLDESGGCKKVAIYVLGQFECLKIFNSGQPLHGLYYFEANEFKNSHKFESLPSWFLNSPKIVSVASATEKLAWNFTRQTFI